MHQSFCDGLSAVYPQSASVADPRRNCATQSSSSSSSTGRSADLPSVIQHQHNPQQQTTTPATSFPVLSFNSGFQQYPQSCPPTQIRSGTTSSPGIWPTPPSTTYEGDDIDGYSYHSSPTSATSAANPSLQLSTNPSTTSPRSWSSPEAHQMSFSQGLWDTERMTPYDVRVYTPATYEDQFQQPMAPASYPQPAFTLRNDSVPSDASYHRDAPGMAVSTMPEAHASLPSQAASPPLKEEFEPSYQVAEISDIQDHGHADTEDGEETHKVEEPYAQLIYRAFMSRDEHAMTLQEIYQWFRDNTDKAKSEGKGWQNSIRHNLSMNAAFCKQERKPTPGDPLIDPDVKKSTEWVLQDWAVRDGVQSTTRYRKGNPGRRAGGSHGRLHGNPSARASSGRKGGLSASRARAANHRRHIINHTNQPQLHHPMPNSPFLNGHREPLHEAFYNRPIGYHYDSSTRDEPVTPPEANMGDQLFHEPMSSAGISTVSGTHGYAYGSHAHAHPGQTNPGYHHHQPRPEAMYSLHDVTGSYQGPAAHMSARAHGNAPALPSGFGPPLFANADEINDNKVGYLHWGASATSGPYQP
ncbi:hypothetical protein F4810DRAFT_706684 [Camillea tinctor]|nr:hypothetical protein F4810DRAFT_706684 [Camillea tinctor]